MCAILTQQGLADTLRGDEEESDSEKEKSQSDIQENVMCAITLCLGDKPSREVSRETTVATIWLKLKKLYMTKSLANRMYMKQKLYSFNIGEDKNISGKIEEYTKIIDDLENIEIKLEDEARR